MSRRLLWRGVGGDDAAERVSVREVFAVRWLLCGGSGSPGLISPAAGGAAGEGGSLVLPPSGERGRERCVKLVFGRCLGLPAVVGQPGRQTG